MEVTMCWRTVGLFVVTAFAEIIGCYLSWLWLKKGASFLLMLPAAVSFSLFVWLLSLHPAAAGRVYASYGGVYVSVALFWLWAVDGIRPPYIWDIAGWLSCLQAWPLLCLLPTAEFY